MRVVIVTRIPPVFLGFNATITGLGHEVVGLLTSHDGPFVAELLGVLEDLHLVAVADQPVGDGESSDTCSDNENPHLLRPCSCSWLPPPILSARGLPPGCRWSHRVSGEPEKWSPR